MGAGDWALEESQGMMEESLSSGGGGGWRTDHSLLWTLIQ